eukprot:GFUD01043719.1.p1 GENE.GFUD01043719.1~~GFUD01043719.1.p1  ORF type:complete len:246 (-),score=49.92 GFUD01043719.1:83-820(-)
MNFHVIFMLAVPFLVWDAGSKYRIVSSDVNGGRHYWYWVSACSEWAIQSQDRYFCTLDGKIECKEGWHWNMCQGPMCAYLETPETFCSQPKCSEGCHPFRGHCETPNTCMCKNGYEGVNCTGVIALPGCKHGVAMSKEKHCVCYKGWKGDLCDIPICMEGCSETNGYCTEPGFCRCKLGWCEDDCKQCVPYPGCDEEHGSCVKPWECNCQDGWSGNYCNETIPGWFVDGSGDDKETRRSEMGLGY